jgi:hypothetical protein
VVDYLVYRRDGGLTPADRATADLRATVSGADGLSVEVGGPSALQADMASETPPDADRRRRGPGTP